MEDLTAQVEKLSKEVRALQDQRQLSELLARYSFLADLGRVNEYVNLYTEDGVIDLVDMNLGRAQGHAQLLKFIQGPEATGAANVGMHLAFPNVFYVNGDEAIGEGYSMTIVREMSGPDEHGEGEPAITPIEVKIVHANYSRWTFRRVNNEWKIKERKIRLLGSPEAAQIIQTSH